MKVIGCFTGLCCLLFSLSPAPARADGKSQAAKEVAEFILQRFGKQAAREGVATLAGRIEALALRHGSEVLQAARKVGPRAVSLLEQAGVHGKDAARLLALHGEQAALVLGKANGLALCLKHGDGVVFALVKHPGIAEPVIEKFGAKAIRALEVAGPQSGRRLALMMESGDLARIGRSPELLEVIAKYGDRAMTFIWDHKGVLAGGTLLAAFLADPEPFLSNVVRPVAELPGKVASEVAGKANWTLLLLVVVLIAAAFIAIRLGYWRLLFQRRDTPHLPAGAAQEATSAERTATRNGNVPQSASEPKPAMPTVKGFSKLYASQGDPEGAPTKQRSKGNHP